MSSALINKIRRQANYNLRPDNYKLVSSLLLLANIHSGRLYYIERLKNIGEKNIIEILSFTRRGAMIALSEMNLELIDVLPCHRHVSWRLDTCPSESEARVKR